MITLLLTQSDDDTLQDFIQDLWKKKKPISPCSRYSSLPTRTNTRSPLSLLVIKHSYPYIVPEESWPPRSRYKPNTILVFLLPLIKLGHGVTGHKNCSRRPKVMSRSRTTGLSKYRKRGSHHFLLKRSFSSSCWDAAVTSSDMWEVSGGAVGSGISMDWEFFNRYKPKLSVNPRQ